VPRTADDEEQSFKGSVMATSRARVPKALMDGGKCKPTRGAKKCVHTTGKAKFAGGKGSGKGGKGSTGGGK
jgi:hypothetical protein